LLSVLSEEALVKTLSEKGLPRFTKNTITDIALFKKELLKCKKLGYATDNEEFEESLKCVAAPVYDKGEIVAAISISTHSERFNKETSRYVSMVKGTAKAISDALSQYDGPDQL
jgi:DNA-binding IclR family transcriptional regulator